MLGAVTFLAALIYTAARRRPTSPADYLAGVLCVGLMVVILRW
jgi:hypothetical protein